MVRRIPFQPPPPLIPEANNNHLVKTGGEPIESSSHAPYHTSSQSIGEIASSHYSDIKTKEKNREQRQQRRCIRFLPACCFVKVRRYIPEIDTTKGLEENDNISLRALHQGTIEPKDILAALERKIEGNASLQKHLLKSISSLQKKNEGQMVSAWMKHEVQRSLKKLSSLLAQQISEEKGSCPITESSLYMHPAIFSELSSSILSQNSHYASLHTYFSAFKNEEKVRASNAIMNSFFEYTLYEKIALYCTLLLMREKGIDIEDELLVILDLNIRNQAELIKVQHIAQYREGVGNITRDIATLAKVAHLPSSLLHPSLLQRIVKLQNSALFRHSQSREECKNIFEWEFIDQRSLLPSSVHFNSSGACLLLSRLYSYFLYTKGCLEGKKQFIQCVNELSKISIYKQEHAVSLLRALCAFNEDILMSNPANIVVEEDLGIEIPEDYNKNTCLTLLELASILFNPQSCKGKTHFLITEQTHAGLHACALVREVYTHPITHCKEVTLHYLEPNYGIITTNNQQLFEHAMIRIKKAKHGFGIEYDIPENIEGYRNRFGNQLLDIIEGRFFNNPYMLTEPLKTEEVDEKKVSTFIYNHFQHARVSILPRLYSLWMTWNTLEELLKGCRIALPLFSFEEGEEYTPADLYQFYKECNLKEDAEEYTGMLQNTLLSFDLYQASEYKDRLYRFLGALLYNLEQRCHTINEYIRGREEYRHLTQAIKALLCSITNVRQYMNTTIEYEHRS